MERWVGKVAVVTGASSGIGEATCKLLVEKGMIVVGFARREERLQKLKEALGENFHYVKVDICSEENILEAFSWVKNTLKSVDVLVNNAGVLKESDLLGNTAEWKLMYDTNVIGPNICSREAIKIMKELQIKGHIFNVNSVAGHAVIPGMPKIAVYSSTKFSVTSLTEYLRNFMSMENLPIRVTSVSPGLVETEMPPFDLAKFEENTKLQPIDIAEGIVFALAAPQRVNVSEITIRPSSENFTDYYQK